MSGAGPEHVPVLLQRVLTLLAPAVAGRAAVLVDATVGLGGHAAALLGAHPGLRLVGVDRDADALAVSNERLRPYRERVTTLHAGYDELPALLSRLGLARVHGVLFDLGVSSLQLDLPARGFAYARDAPLDMRMDQTGGPTAADIVNTYTAAELTRVLATFGQERFARRIAEAIVRERAGRPLRSTSRLAEIVRTAVPAATRRTGGHPAKRSFQALRIEVNGELAALGRALPAAIAALEVGGRLVVLSYQSLEDRLVKRSLVQASTHAAPPDLPVLPAGAEPALRLLTRGAEKAGPREVEANPRSASVRLRAAERVRAAA